MHVEPVVAALAHRQRAQELNCASSSWARVHSITARFDAHHRWFRARWPSRGCPDDHGALRDVLAHQVDHPRGVGAVADEVAEKGPRFSALLARVGQHGFDGLAIGVQVGD
jgi:hypothetical protein